MVKTIGKILFIIGGISAHCQIFAQDFSFNCFQYASYGYQHRGDTSWVHSDFLVDIDFGKKLVKFHNKEAFQYEILKSAPLVIEKDGNTLVFVAIDKTGDSCMLDLKLFREISYHIATLVVRYPAVMHSYRLQEPKPVKPANAAPGKRKPFELF